MLDQCDLISEKQYIVSLRIVHIVGGGEVIFTYQFLSLTGRSLDNETLAWGGVRTGIPTLALTGKHRGGREEMSLLSGRSCMKLDRAHLDLVAAAVAGVRDR